jgi:hypothetical protein
MDTTLKSVQLFTHPTRIQLVPDSVIRLIWCGCKSYIPCSSRDCGYKRNGFGFWIYSSLRMLWFLCKFKKLICPVIIFRLGSTIDGQIWHLKSSHSEFTRFPVRLKKLWNALCVIICFPKFSYVRSAVLDMIPNVIALISFYSLLPASRHYHHLSMHVYTLHACIYRAPFGKFEINVKFSRC